MARASDDQDDVVFKSKAAERCIGTHWDRIPSVAKAASVCGTARTIWPCLQRAHTSSGRTGRNGEKLEEMKPAVSDRCQRLKHQANRCCSGGWWRCQMPIPPTGRLSGFGMVPRFSLAIQLPESRNHQISISTSHLGKYFCHDISLLRNRHRNENLTCSPRHNCDTMWGAKAREKS